MSIGLGLGLTLRQYSSNREDPLIEVFTKIQTDGEDSGLYVWDVNLSSVYQDTGGTTPAELGDPVGRVNEYYGKNIPLIQGTTSLKPTLVQGTGSYLEANHQSDHLAVDLDGAGLAMQIGQLASGLGGGHILAGFRDNISPGTSTFMNYFAGVDAASGVDGRLRVQRQGSDRMWSQSLVGTNYNVFWDGAMNQGVHRTIRLRNKTALSGRGIQYYEDGVLGASQGNSVTGLYNVTNFYVGCTGGLTEYHQDFSWSCVMLINWAVVSDANITLLENAIGARNG